MDIILKYFPVPSMANNMLKEMIEENTGINIGNETT